MPVEGSYTYTVADNKATITAYGGAGGAVTIPSVLGGYDVVAIGDDVFNSNSVLEEVVIPDSIITIGKRVFYGCTFLTQATVGNGVTTIDDEAFEGIYDLHITLGNHVEVIGYRALAYSGIPSLILPTSLTTIGDEAFAGNLLTEIIVPDGVTLIPYGLCVGCRYLQNVTVGNAVSNIGMFAFSECNLRNVNFRGLIAPTVEYSWISSPHFALRGHALSESNFPPPGEYFGLLMGDYYIPTTVPGVPTSFTTSPQDTFVILNWGVPSIEGGTPITGYNIYRSDSETGTYVLLHNTSNLTYSDTGLTNEQTYWYKIGAVNAVGEGALTDALDATPTHIITVPGVSRNVVISPEYRWVVITWDAPTSDGGSVIINYNIYRSDTVGGTYTLISSPTLRTYTDSGLISGNTYWYKVSAVNSVGEGTFTTASSATLQTKYYRDYNIQVGMGVIPTIVLGTILDVMTENDVSRLITTFPTQYATWIKYIDIQYTSSSEVLTTETYPLSVHSSTSYSFEILRKFTYEKKARIQFRIRSSSGQESVDPSILTLNFKTAFKLTDLESIDVDPTSQQTVILQGYVTQHALRNATYVDLGHVQVNGTSIYINEKGVISCRRTW